MSLADDVDPEAPARETMVAGTGARSPAILASLVSLATRA